LNHLIDLNSLHTGFILTGIMPIIVTVLTVCQHINRGFL